MLFVDAEAHTVEQSSNVLLRSQNVLSKGTKFRRRIEIFRNYFHLDFVREMGGGIGHDGDEAINKGKRR